MTPYSYMPLQHQDDIRLIEIHPGEYADEIVRCEIIHARRTDESISYEAISYTWGDATHLKTIVIGEDSASIDVTSNCYDVLRRFRKLDVKRRLWIDAICINQEDNDERTQQVQIMGQIYEGAAGVLVYLGEADEFSTRVFQHVQRTYDDSGHYKVAQSNDDAADDDIETARVKAALLKAKQKLLTRPWFSRVWVLQEIYFGFSITVFCGAESVHWSNLAVFYDAGTYGNPLRRDVPYILHIGSGRENTDLFGLLYQTRYAGATDPRDKYFGIMSMVRDEEDQVLSATYDQSVETIYTAIGFHLIKQYGLRLLQAIRHPHAKQPAMASWIPDWSFTNENNARWIDYVSDRGDYDCNIAFKILDCCHERTADHRYHPVLSITGYRTGTIKSFGTIFDFHDPSEYCLQILLLLLAGKVIMKSEIEYLPSDFTGSMSKDDFKELCLRKYTAGVEDEASLMRASMHNCKLFVDENNHLGLAPAEAAVGDAICIFEDAMEPCLLRERRGGGWSLVSGECYYRGIVEMDHREDLDDYLDGFDILESYQRESFEIW